KVWQGDAPVLSSTCSYLQGDAFPEPQNIKPEEPLRTTSSHPLILLMGKWRTGLCSGLPKNRKMSL
ncbi:hypothetical protein P7K49_036501, partial [Saguinus oedipus]